jgi:hypothetical protein
MLRDDRALAVLRTTKRNKFGRKWSFWLIPTGVQVEELSLNVRNVLKAHPLWCTDAMNEQNDHFVCG